MILEFEALYACVVPLLKVCLVMSYSTLLFLAANEGLVGSSFNNSVNDQQVQLSILVYFCSSDVFNITLLRNVSYYLKSVHYTIH